MAEIPKLYYFADPMCSWCYGFQPVIDQIRAEYGANYDIRLVMGGLRPGKLAETMTPARARIIRHHWRDVAKMTLQPFDENFFERENFVYDTEPAAKAVIVMEQLAPQHAYAYYHEIQQAFYARNQDITAPETLAALAQPYGVAAVDFLQAFHSEAAHKETWGQFTFSAGLGIRGFPALVLEDKGQFLLVTRGWQPFVQIQEILGRHRGGDREGDHDTAFGHSATEGSSCNVQDGPC